MKNTLKCDYIYNISLHVDIEDVLFPFQLTNCAVIFKSPTPLSPA